MLKNVRVLYTLADQHGVKFQGCEPLVALLEDPGDGDDLGFDMGAYHGCMTSFFGLKEIQDCLNMSGVQTDYSIHYFIKHLDRICASNYVPTKEDILNLKIKTTGLQEICFKYQDVDIRVVDVGGQKNERRKWIHAFDCVTSIIYVVSLIDFTLVLEEDNTTNRMQDSLALFKTVINNKWLRETPVCVFLNKTDLFTEIYPARKEEFRKCFPEFEGDKEKEALDFVLQKFKKLNGNSTRHVYDFLTCATDTDKIRMVFEAVSDIILTQKLDDFFAE